MPGIHDQGSIPHGLVESTRARAVDPGKLQSLGKQAAALHVERGMPLTEAVVSVIGKDDVGSEHARRICEFANQEAFRHEWEKGGSVRNVEISGGLADPATVLLELNDGARPDPIRTFSDYDSPPPALSPSANALNVEEQIFGKHAAMKEVVAGAGDLYRLRQVIDGARQHLGSRVDTLEMEKVMSARLLADAVTDAVLGGNTTGDIMLSWSSVGGTFEQIKEAMEVCRTRMRERGVSLKDTAMEKLASSSPRAVNTEHPVIKHFVAFSKLAQQRKITKNAHLDVTTRLSEVNKALRGVL